MAKRQATVVFAKDGIVVREITVRNFSQASLDAIGDAVAELERVMLPYMKQEFDQEVTHVVRYESDE